MAHKRNRENQTPKLKEEAIPKEEIDWSNYKCSLCLNSNEINSKYTLDWIQCDICDEWYHNLCVEISKSQANNYISYHCFKCRIEHGPSELKRKSRRKKLKIDYNALNEGNKNITCDKHPYWKYIEADSFNYYTSKQVQTVTGSQLTSFVNDIKKIETPLYIPSKDTEGIDMVMPGDLSVAKVAELIGPDTSVEVMDVLTQNNSPGWELGKWKEYYNSDPIDRDRVLNVISLEFGKTPMEKLVTRPYFVRHLDLVDKVWGSLEQNLNNFKPPEKPATSLYCLMSVSNSYTDFHIDFGGSSVYYHVIYGHKIFIFAPPTKSNLSQYEKWCLRSDQNTCFLGDFLKFSFRVDLYSGDSLIIPSGYIHSVYTVVDSLVIGGNFLTTIDLSMQLKISEIEINTKVPKKFTFPYFDKVLWLTAFNFLNYSNQVLNVELEGIKSLYNYLKKQVNIMNQDSMNKEKKNAKAGFPNDLISNSDIFLNDFKQWLIEKGIDT